MHVIHVSVGCCTHYVSGCPIGPEEDFRSPQSEVIGICAIHRVGSGKRTQALCNSSQVFLITEKFLQPPIINFAVRKIIQTVYKGGKHYSFILE